MSITAADVNRLRQMTGAGMMDCKKALSEANGDFDAAIDILRKKGQKVSAARADRETTEGAVFIKTNAGDSQAWTLALGCETDFVAKNDSFQELGKNILEIASNAGVSTADDVLSLPYEGITIGEKITEMVGKIGEKISIVAFESITGEKVCTYIHSNGKIGVMLALNGINGSDVSGIGKDVAMHIAAMKPIALTKDEVPSEVVTREREIAIELARNEGKPEAMLEKIAEGRVNKFYKEATLLAQEFVKDNSKTIAQALDGASKGLTATGFKRVSIG